MTLPTIPRVMYDGGNLDVEAVNENLRGASRNIRRNMDLRFSTTAFVVALDGLRNTDSATGARSFIIPTILEDSSSRQVISAELVIYAEAGTVWTLTSTSDTSWPGVSVTSAGTTTEAVASTDLPVAITTGSDSTTFLMTASGTSTITRGYIIFTLLCDRGQISNASFTGYTPNLFSSVTSTAGSTLDTEMTNAAAAVTQETNAQNDLRIMCFSVRNLESGGSRAMRIPSGNRRAVTLGVYGLATAPVTSTLTGTVASATIGTVTDSAPGSGVSTLAAFFGAKSILVDDANAPGTTAQDITLTISRGADGGAVAPLAYILVWWA